MIIHDISQEVFGSAIFPGDAAPTKRTLLSLDKEIPDICQLSEITLGSHTGTHMDAPRHFYKDGKCIDQIDLDKCVGICKVVEADGVITVDEMDDLLKDGTQRILIKGNIEITIDVAKILTHRKIKCIGVEGLTIGPLSAPKEVHLELLGQEIVMIEGLRLADVKPGKYILAAQPLKLGGLDGSPLRAILMEE